MVSLPLHRKRSLLFYLEAGLVMLLLWVAAHFVSERIASRGLPGGDEGSWLSAAVELSRGNGFSTLWMEYHFLEPYTLPRPDDYRYPALVTLLALSFTLWGEGLDVALHVVGLLFLLFAFCAYLVTRVYFNPATAVITLALTVFSLLQLGWNTVVYTEGLFGLVLGLLLLWMYWVKGLWWRWGGVGFWLALLYLVRPNAVLFVPALILVLMINRKDKALWKVAGLCLMVWVLCLLPWWVRNAIHFGNPLHIAGSAGLLRETTQDPATYSILQFLQNYGPWFPIKRVLLGSWEFLKTLHFYEHGLQILPLVGVLLGGWRRERFYNPFILGGFLITLLMCFYTNYNAWAGTRYFSPFLPFVYGYGIYNILETIRNVATGRFALRWREAGPFRRWRVGLRFGVSMPWISGLRFVLPFVLGLVALLPVVNPHRFYERKYATPPAPVEHKVEEYVRYLHSLAPEGNAYFARSLGQLNFLVRRPCVGLQSSEYLTALEKGLKTFQPRVLALTEGEAASEEGRRIIANLQREGLEISQTIRLELGRLYVFE